MIDALILLSYYGGWADKFSGKTIEVTDEKFGYTLHEPIGAVGCIIPWNFPRTFASAIIALSNQPQC